MSIFDAFKKEKKSSDKPLPIMNPVFGEVLNFKNWYSREFYSITLWDKNYNINLVAFENNANDPITPEQEASCLRFKNDLSVYQNCLESALEDLFHISDKAVLRDKIKVKSVIFSKDGKMCFDLSADFDYGYLEECGIGPDEDFGFSLYPDIQFFPSNEELLDYLE